ncbi:hypothetical protein [Paenibacillus sp. P32E]|uniref:hypothetical protein n=1 Tax=Paenibacillus sp. P32E TaxID=1349434 RepID=UPI00096770F7|nr:hypothetical protein [Paenibacillus sp. P32E]OKP86581.1 hypothetical protein A3848_21465 [Paenibacillus sp. P32E]
MEFDHIKPHVIKWMKSNGLKLLAAIIGILVVVVAAEIITGGAITAALPMIINLITVYLQADAIKSVAQTLVQASGYIGTYLSQGWQKMVEPAAIALATALAMGLVELAMELGFKAIGKGLNKAGQAVKKGVGAAASGAKAVAGAGVKGIKSLLKTGAKLASKSGSMIIRGGKIVIKSLQKGLMKGAKKLQGLVDRILQKFKFKRFKLERKGKHIRLYGEVNPWVLLIDGELRDIKEQNLEKELKKLELDGKKPIKLSDAEYSKLNNIEPNKRAEISKGADGDKSKLDLDNLTDTGEVFEITLTYDKKMPKREFEKKAIELKKLGEQGLIYKLQNPVARNPAVTREYRQDMIKRIWNQYGQKNPEFGKKLIDRITKRMQPDHIWELQLGGPDSVGNLRFLDSFTN